MISSCVHVTLCFAVLHHWLVGWLVGLLVGWLVVWLVSWSVCCNMVQNSLKLGHQNLLCPTSLGVSEQ